MVASIFSWTNNDLPGIELRGPDNYRASMYILASGIADAQQSSYSLQHMIYKVQVVTAVVR